MKETLVSTHLGVSFRVNHFSTLDELKTHVKGNEVRIVEICNLYGQQKGALVEARDKLVDAIVAASKFAPKMTTPKALKNPDGKPRLDEAGKPVMSKPQWSETEGEYLKRFKAAVDKGEVPGWTKETYDAKLQETANALGVFGIDLNQTERAPAKSKIRDINTKRAESLWSDTYTTDKPGKWKVGDKKPTTLAQRLDAKAKEFAKAGVTFVPFNTGNKEVDLPNLAAAIQSFEDSKKDEAYA